MPQFIGVRCPNELKTNAVVCSGTVAVALVCRDKNTTFHSYGNFLRVPDGIVTVRVPVFLEFTLHLMSLVWGEHIDAAVRSLLVVESYRFVHGVSQLLDTGESLSVQQLVLDGVVDALGHCVVLRVSVLGHAGDDTAAFQYFDVVGAGVLRAAVGVVDECVAKAFGQCADGHLQRTDAVCGLQRRSHIPSQNALAVGVHDDGQEHETVALWRVGILYPYVGDIADPYVVGSHGDYALDEVGVGRQVVAGVRRAGRTWPPPQVESALVHDAAERVASHTVFLGELATVHPPQFVHPYLRVFLPHSHHILHHKLLNGETCQQGVLVPLVKGLSCHTGQCTKTCDRISPHFVFVQPFDCPVPAFFLIWILNISSATSIIVP